LEAERSRLKGRKSGLSESGIKDLRDYGIEGFRKSAES
jgi:hypothetical protein